MKYMYLTALFFVIPFINSWSQPVSSSALSYVEVYNVPGFSTGELGKYIRNWMSAHPNRADAAGYYEDTTGSTLIFYGFMPAKRIRRPLSLTEIFNDGAVITYTMRVEIREGRYRVRVDNLIHKDPEGGIMLSINEDGSANYLPDLGLGLLTDDEEVPYLNFSTRFYKKSNIVLYWNQVKQDAEENISEMLRSLRTYLDEAKRDDDW